MSQLTTGEKIKVLAKRRSITISVLANKVGMSRQNFSYKLDKNKLYSRDIAKCAEALDCTFIGEFVMNDTKEKL